MSMKSDYALPMPLPMRPERSVGLAVRQFGHDVAMGAVAMSKMTLFMLCGALVVLAVTLALNAQVRERAIRLLPTSALAWASGELQAREAAKANLAQQVATSLAPAPERSVFVDEVQQRHVTQYLARRYRVAEEAMRALVAVAHESGAEAGVDPLLILSVMAVESSMNPFAESTVGAQGLMQVMTRVHADKFESHGGDLAALDPVANIKVGTLILKDLIRRGGSVERGLQLYVGAGNLPHDGGYGKRVLGEHARLKLAAQGKVELALLNGWRGTQPELEFKSTPVSTTGAKSENTVPAKPAETPIGTENADEAA